jgi:hypothetical protein
MVQTEQNQMIDLTDVTTKLNIPKHCSVELSKNYDEPFQKKRNRSTAIITTLLFIVWCGLSATVFTTEERPGKTSPLNLYIIFVCVGAFIALLIIMLHIFSNGPVTQDEHSKWESKWTYYFKDNENKEYKFSAIGNRVDRYYGLPPSDKEPYYSLHVFENEKRYRVNYYFDNSGKPYIINIKDDKDKTYEIKNETFTIKQ